MKEKEFIAFGFCHAKEGKNEEQGPIPSFQLVCYEHPYNAIT